MSIIFPKNALSLPFIFYLCSVKDDGDNKTVEAKGFGENEDEDHTDVHVVLGVGTDTSVSNDSDGEPSSQSGETTAHTSSEFFVAHCKSEGRGHGRVLGLLNGSKVDDGNNQAVNSENTSHDTGNEGLEHKLGVQDSDGADADSRLGSTVSSTEVGEHKGHNDSHVTEEGGLVNLSQLQVLLLLDATIVHNKVITSRCSSNILTSRNGSHFFKYYSYNYF